MQFYTDLDKWLQLASDRGVVKTCSGGKYTITIVDGSYTGEFSYSIGSPPQSLILTQLCLMTIQSVETRRRQQLLEDLEKPFLGYNPEETPAESFVNSLRRRVKF